MFSMIQQLDTTILLAIQNLHHPVADVFLTVITTLGNGGMIWIALAIVLLLFRKTRKYGVMMALSLLLSSVVGNLILKPLIARPRPFVTIADVAMVIPPPGGYSFPSGHTMSSFAAAMVLWKLSWKAALPATLLAGTIAFSRLYLFCHYPTDVLFGAVFGSLIAAAVVWLFRKTSFFL